MGISVSQPSTIDRSYTPKIVGLTRLWGGANWSANQLIKAGATPQQLSYMYAANYPNDQYPAQYNFMSDGMWGIIMGGNNSAIFDSETGRLIAYLKANSSVPQHQVDLNGRYAGSGGTWYNGVNANGTGYSWAQATPGSGLTYITDNIFNTTLNLPYTQDDIDGINAVLELTNFTYVTGMIVNISPLANYVLAGFEWGNQGTEYATYEVMFKTTLAIEPWAWE